MSILLIIIGVVSFVLMVKEIQKPGMPGIAPVIYTFGMIIGLYGLFL